MTVAAGSLSIKNLNELAEIAGQIGVPVHGAPALGVPLHTNGNLGADLLAVPPHGQFPIHTHPGDHLLLCVAGQGTISVGGKTYAVGPGDIYLVPGLVPHAVGAGEAGHILVAIGSPHKAVQARDRMQLTGWDGEQLDDPAFPQ